MKGKNKIFSVLMTSKMIQNSTHTFIICFLLFLHFILSFEFKFYIQVSLSLRKLVLS